MNRFTIEGSANEGDLNDSVRGSGNARGFQIKGEHTLTVKDIGGHNESTTLTILEHLAGLSSNSKAHTWTPPPLEYGLPRPIQTSFWF
jgi:hypothetical protein